MKILLEILMILYACSSAFSIWKDRLASALWQAFWAVIILAVLLFSSGCTLGRMNGQWVFIGGLPSSIEAGGVAADNRIISITLDTIEVDND